MSTVSISLDHQIARLQATASFAVGAGVSRIDIYSDTDLLLVSVPIADPPGTIDMLEGVLRLEPAQPLGSMIPVTGVASYAKWVRGDDVLIAQGGVTDLEGAGPFRVGGSTGTQLYRGGYLLLGATGIT